MKSSCFRPSYSSLGGLEQVPQNLARRLAALEHRSLFITAPNHARTAPSISGVEVRGVPIVRPRKMPGERTFEYVTPDHFLANVSS